MSSRAAKATSSQLVLPQGGWWPEKDFPAITRPRVKKKSAVVPMFSDDRWPLAGLGTTGNQRPPTLNFMIVPEKFRVTAKRFMWLAINTKTPAEILNAPGTHARPWLASRSLVILLRQIVYLFGALAKEHDDLASVNAYVLSEYCQSVLTAVNTRGCNLGAREKEARLHAVERLHYSAPDLPASDRLRRPSWLDEELRLDRTWRGENTTQEMAPETYAPLIVWACAFIDEFATDILAARDRVAQMTDGAVAPQPGKGADAVRAALRDWLATHGSLPGTSKNTWGVDRGQVSLASTYLEGVFGNLSRSALQWVYHNDAEFRDATVTRGAPLDVHVRGRVHGQQWLPGIDFYDVDFWLARLREACMIVVGLGTALRPHEMLSLEIEASKDDGTSRPVIEKVESDTGHVRFLVHGRLFKGQTDISGSQRLDGIPVTWETIETGAKAAALAIQLTDGSPLLFPSH